MTRKTAPPNSNVTPLDLNRSVRSNTANRAPKNTHSAAPTAPQGKPDPRILDDVFAWLSDYIVTPSPDDLRVLTLWAAHTWFADVLPTSPRLQIDSISPGSGKTTVLEHFERLTRDPSQMSTISSAALLVRMLDQRPRTLLLDEVDRALDPKADLTKDLVAVLNSGYKRGATRPVLVPGKDGGWDVKEMTTYAPVALSGNSPRLPDDTVSRLIRVVLMPDAEGRAKESDWESIDKPARELGSRLSAWSIYASTLR